MDLEAAASDVVTSRVHPIHVDAHRVRHHEPSIQIDIN